MSRVIYDFLVDSILFDDIAIQTQFKDVSKNELEKILLEYREHCIKNIDTIVKEVKSNASTLKVVSTLKEIPYSTLKQCALYIQQFIIDDPLFMLTRVESEASEVMTTYLGFEKDGINKESLSKAVSLLKSLTPMVAGDYIKLFPISFYFEPPDKLPINYSETLYRDALPREILEYCYKHAQVQSMAKTERGWETLPKLDLTPSILIDFKNKNDRKAWVYHYHKMKPIKFEDDFMDIQMNLAEYPMDKNTWDLWVYQSLNQAAKAEVETLYFENLIASDLNATYLCTNDFHADLLTLSFPIEETIQTATASQLLNLEVPFLEKINTERLMSIRNQEQIFENFRIDLEKQFRELRLISDPTELAKRQENIMHELGTVRIQEIDQKLKSLRSKGLSELLISMGGLAGIVQTSGWSLLAASVATVQGFKTYSEYKNSIRQNPSFFLWKVLKK